MASTFTAFDQLDRLYRRSVDNTFCVEAWIVEDFSTDDHYRVLVITHNEQYEDKHSKFQLSFYSHHSEEIDPKFVDLMVCSPSEIVCINGWRLVKKFS